MLHAIACLEVCFYLQLDARDTVHWVPHQPAHHVLLKVALRTNPCCRAETAPSIAGTARRNSSKTNEKPCA